MSTPINSTLATRASDANEMYVLKRSGTREIVSFDKILRRIKTIGQEVGIKINYTNLVIKVIDQLYDNISTTKLDELSAEQCAVMASIHTDYNTLAGRITISNHHKNTSNKFSEIVKILYENTDNVDRFVPLISKELYDIVCSNADFLDEICDYSRDYLIDYFGFKTLEKSYLIRKNKRVIERPQHMWLRVALGIHGNDFVRAIETYNLMSNKYFTHATPTLFNAGTAHPQLSSCYLLAMEEDSIDGIYNTLKDCAIISKWAGGIGLHIHNIRATGSHINGTNGYSNGIVPMLRVFNNTARYVDQCVSPETFIYTTDGPKRIWSCTVGKTAVITKHGNAEIIKDVLEHNYSGEVYKIFTDHSIEPLTITGEHPVYVLRNYVPEMAHLPNVIDKNTDVDWIDAKELCDTDMFIYPIPKYTVDISGITAEDCYMYGLMLYSGSSGYFVLHKTRQDYIKNFIIEYFEKKIVEYSIEIKLDEFSNEYWEICWSFNNMIHLPFRYSDFYNEYGDEHINSRWLNLPVEKTKYIVKGYCDNCDKGTAIINDSIFIIESMKYLCLKMGVLPTGYYDVRDDFNMYVLQIPITPEMAILFDITYNTECDDNLTYFKYKDALVSKITKIEVENYEGVLYDLQLEKEHNYLLTNGLVHNGGGKRNGSFAIYLEPWHSDIELFLQMRKNHGDEELKARDLFYSLWMPDLFMERVKSGGIWTLMCPHECPGLSDVYGDDFKNLYESYEIANKGRKTMNARDLWFQILDAQMETGTPYIVYKDAANKKSNQKNVGTIKSSNLCVAPETKILTDEGYITIKSAVNKSVKVWNGQEFSEVIVRKTGENQELIDITMSDGNKLTCTKYHKFYIYEDNYDKTELYQSGNPVRVVEAKDLKKNDRISRFRFPIIDVKDKDLQYAFYNGMRCGTMILECDLLQYNVKDIGINDEEHPLFVPINYSLKSKLNWFSGLCDSLYKNVSGPDNGPYNSIRIQSANRDMLINIKYMLNTCGINPGLYLDNSKEPESASTFTLTVTADDVVILIGYGFHCYIVDLMFGNKGLTVPDMPNEVYMFVVNIEDVGRIDDTYCFTEPLRNSGVFNGILTSQCTEILEYSDSKETAVCNLASIALPAFVEQEGDMTTFNYKKLHDITKVVIYNLNRVIDVNFYPTEKTERSNKRHRPVGLGVQGLADVFMMMGFPFSSKESVKMNKDIFETIYHAALEESCEIAKRDGPYSTFVGSPASQGILQFDLWGVDPGVERYDWLKLKEEIKTHGIRNSLLLAPMPTASTSQILGYNECIEPITSNIYSRCTIAGEFIMANKYLMNDLIKLDLWNEKLKNNIIANNGSIQQLTEIPANIREKYKTVWEMGMVSLIDMAADRGAFICQSQSLNLWIENPNYNSLTSMHFYGWSKGLKTGIYYLRRKGRHQAQQFTIEPEKKMVINEDKQEQTCEMCSA
jgi:ribonucleoside-diphosphate reductase alpha chain